MNKLFFYILMAILTGTASCSRKDFLNAKPDQSQIIPSTVADCQLLLDNTLYLNGYGSSGYPSLLINGTDDFYCTDSIFDSYSLTDQHVVIWARDIYADSNVEDWSRPYRTIFYANEVLEVLEKLQKTEGGNAGWKKARGSALFFRAFANYQLMQVFAPVYDSLTSSNDPGIPLRLTSDINEKIFRSSVQSCYEKILSDADEAASLLAQFPEDYPTRPSKAAAYGLLARTELCIYDYKKALSFADSALTLRSTLMDYNTLDKTARLPFTRNNPEVIFGAAIALTGPTRKSITDSTLCNSYDNNDLRKTLFFKEGAFFFGRYDEDGYMFCGIATDELFLIRAECQARLGDVNGSMNTLNSLLSTRWITGSFTPFTATDSIDALRLIFMERRKELLFRGLRWTDLRRLNKDDRWAVTLTRVVGGPLIGFYPTAPGMSMLFPTM